METTKAMLVDLIKVLGDSYAEQVLALPIKPKTRDCLIDGFRAGVAAGVRHTVKMLGVDVKE